MRNALLMVGIGAIVIIVGAYMINNKSKLSGTTAEHMTSTLTLTSSAFEENAKIPSKFTCDGEQINPPLSFSGVSEEAKSLAFLMDDPDVPKALKPDGVFDHWVLFNMPSDTREIPEGSFAGVQGANGAGKNAYTGPCPPAQYEPSEHRYVFKLYALDSMLPLSAGASKQKVLQAMEGHIIGETELIGRYKRK